jgi:hypothetical protein
MVVLMVLVMMVVTIYGGEYCGNGLMVICSGDGSVDGASDDDGNYIWW